MLDNISLLFIVPTWALEFHSARTAGNGDTWLSAVTLMLPDVQSAMELTQLNTTERRHGVAPKTKNSSVWLPKSESLVSMSSSAWTAKETIKWIAIAVLTGTIISIEVGTIENHRNSSECRVQQCSDPVILVRFSFSISFLSLFLFLPFFFNSHVVCPSMYCSY